MTDHCTCPCHEDDGYCEECCGGPVCVHVDALIVAVRELSSMLEEANLARVQWSKEYLAIASKPMSERVVELELVVGEEPE